MAADITSLVVEVKSVGIKEASTALSGLGTSAANAERRINSLIEATKKMNVANELAAKSSQSIVTRLREQDALLGNMAANSRTAARGTADLAAAMTLLSTSLNLMNQNLQRAEVVQRRHNNEMREAHALARGLSGSLGALWLTYGNFAGMAVGLAIGASLKGIVQVGVDVEHTLEGIRVRGNETVESIQNLREVVQDLGKGVYGPQEVAKALETLVLAGLNASQAASSIGAALNLATVGGVSIEKAATTLVSVGTAVGYVAEGFGRVGDVIAKTAALSMSSVESLSEAFKSASSVNRLYGVSLEDIGTSLGVLSNLGIQGSAAGTALKNFYKELASESEKVGGTFRDMGITQAMLKDTEGNFKPLLEVVEMVDGALKSLSASESKLAQGRISNERGQRLLTQLLGEYNTELGNGENALERFRRNVDNSYGFAAKGAAQMALTAKSQIDSMFNTLKSSFADTFTSIEPELIAFTARMKGIFNSKEFKEGIIGLAESFASLAISVAENLPLLAKLAAAFVTIKVALGIVPLLQLLPGIFASITTAVAGLAAGTVTLTTLFPPLLAVVGAAIVALTAYNMLKGGQDADRAAKNAEAYSNGYLDGLNKEAEHLEKVNTKMKERKSLSEINAEIEKDESRKRMVQLDQLAIKEAEANLAKTRGNFDVSAALKATQELDRARAKAANNLKLVAAAEEALFNQAKKNKELTEAIAKENRKVEQDAPTNKLSVKVNGAAVNDEYAAAIAKLTAQVKTAKKDILNFDDTLNDKLKAGEIGKLQVIRESTKNQLEEYAKIDEALKKQIDIASKGKNKKADVERFSGLQEANTEAIEQAKRKAAQETDVYISGLRQDAAKEQVKQFEEEGKFVAAAALRWSTDYAPAVKAVQKDFEKYGDTIPEIGNRLRQLESIQAEMMDTARVKELSKEFNVLSLEIGNILKGVQTGSEDQGLAAMFNAAQEATEKYKASLPALEAQLEKLKRFAMADDASTGDKKSYEEAVSQQKSLAEKYKTMWTGVGKSISDSLGGAFGKSGKAAGEMLQSVIKYNNTDNKSIEAKNKLYANLAGSAKGFFKEGSTGYKVLAAAEQAFRAVELANMVKSLFTHSAITTAKAVGTVAGQAVETGAVVAGEAARNAAKVPGVYMSFMSALGPWGMAAAAVAIAAVLGSSFGGGGGGGVSAADRQKKQGTGSVLGDDSAKSDSIAKSLDLIARDSGLGLVHFRSMDSSLKAVVAGLSSLGSNIVQFGGINNLSKEIEGSSSGGFVKNLISSIFGGKTTVQDAGIMFGSNTVGGIESGGVKAQSYNDIKKKGGWFSSDKYSTQTKDLGAGIDKQFADIINNMAATISSAADSLGVGGTAFNDHLKSFVVDLGKISLKDLKGDEVTEALNAIFSKLGDDMAMFAVDGLKSFQKIGEGYLETLSRVANELIQVQDVFAVLGKTMTSTGISAVESSQSFINLFGSIDKLTESTSYFVENFLSDADKLKPIQDSLSKEMKRLGLSSIDTVEEFKNLVLAQDLNTASGQQMYAALMNVAPAFIAVSEASKKAEEVAKKAAEDAANILDKRLEMLLKIAEMENNSSDVTKIVAQQRDIEMKAMDASLRPLQERINFLNDERAAIDAAKATANKDFSVLKASVDVAKASAKASYDSQVAITNAQISSLKAVNTAVTELSTALDSALGSAIEAVGGMSRATAQTLLTNALEKAQATGQLPSASSMKDVFSALSKDSSGSFSSLEDFKKDAGITAGKLSALNDITKSQKSVNELQLEVLNASLEAQKKTYEAEVAGYDSMLSYAQQQLDAMNGTQLATRDVVAALTAFNGSVNLAIVKQQQAGIIANSGVAPTAGQITSPQGVTSAQIADLYKNVLGRTASQVELDFQMDATKKNGWSASDLSQFFYSSPEYLSAHGSHANGLDEVPFDNYRANLHKGEKVLTAKQSKGVAQSEDMQAIVEAVNSLKEDNSAENQALVSDIRYLKKLFQSLSPNGQTLNVTQTIIV
jgi:TP901 family phage tail tape measure protein